VGAAQSAAGRRPWIELLCARRRLARFRCRIIVYLIVRSVDVGIRVPRELLGRGSAALADFGRTVDDSAIDRVWIGDHVSFKGGKGYDGLLGAAVLAAVTRRVIVETAVYLLPLRHPLPVARQVADVAGLAPDRFVFGVGVGGEDPDEVANCGVDPATRGRRMDESLGVVRRLLAGETVDHAGDAFRLERASIRPSPSPAPPIVVGGRSPAALRRAGRLGDGWLGVWVTPERFAANTAEVEREALDAGRVEVSWQHGFLAWCGFGANRDAARGPLARAMEAFYGVAFERFERSSPYGTPDEVAEALAPYVAAGATSILLSPIAAAADDVVADVAHVRAALEEVAR
jgi:alkanesulfonate monooxygenase SsuD/methylene tetrahydromethanopterin reductase-like flavin-dependent oxidoreductase (luciferase family)